MVTLKRRSGLFALGSAQELMAKANYIYGHYQAIRERGNRLEI